jgi:hypothetical protein
MYPNSRQIFHFCSIHGNDREKSKSCCSKMDIKLLFGNAGSNEENNLQT